MFYYTRILKEDQEAGRLILPTLLFRRLDLVCRFAELTHPLSVVCQRQIEDFSVEVGPVAGCEPVFAVGGLPDQEIAQALLARRADDQIGIGCAGRIKELAERLL